MPPRPDRAVSPVLGSVLLVAVTVSLAAVVGSAVLSGAVPAEPPPRATLDCRADAATDRVTCVHGGGDRLDVRDLDVHITVDGEPLAYQPPVPFFAARGFRAGPTGPFNSAADPYWSAGESAAVRLAGTNRPGLTSDARVGVTVTAGDHVVVRVHTTAG
ncbi:type IV pilin [Haloglomus salinum]|uniref:type IV pilin n=1 Tax=Haloglomus salinum TaxID=2962673 RepID=UPI0020C9EBBF|nr:type IV pilin N-terminal domain-containing protein [Haloglomus salinum]